MAKKKKFKMVIEKYNEEKILLKEKNMEGLTVLKIKIYQPAAHYRIPFTSGARRHTYPIPPYSTVIGLLCNLLGIRNEKGEGEPCGEYCYWDYHKLKNIKISICGNFKSKTTEYIWLRNLNKGAHINRFGNIENRWIAGHIEHIGGQSPAVIDILNDVKLVIYIYHEEEKFLEKIENYFKNPEKRIYPLHLGRAEDWIVIEDLKNFKVKISEIEANYEKFFWIPEKIFNSNSEKLKFEFERVNGLIYNLPSFYKIVDGRRQFDYIRTKLNDGDLGGIDIYYDEEENLPLFLADFKEDENGKNSG